MRRLLSRNRRELARLGVCLTVLRSGGVSPPMDCGGDAAVTPMVNSFRRGEGHDPRGGGIMDVPCGDKRDDPDGDGGPIPPEGIDDLQLHPGVARCGTVVKPEDDIDVPLCEGRMAAARNQHACQDNCDNGLRTDEDRSHWSIPQRRESAATVVSSDPKKTGCKGQSIEPRLEQPMNFLH